MLILAGLGNPGCFSLGMVMGWGQRGGGQGGAPGCDSPALGPGEEELQGSWSQQGQLLVGITTLGMDSAPGQG